jgi:hypothetical protein
MGVKKSKYLTDLEILQYAKKYDIPSDHTYKLDTNKFNQMKNEVKDSLAKKDLRQPLQVISYDSHGNLNSHLINCTVSGFPKLDWNYWGSFDHFPLSNNKARKIDTVIPLKTELSIISPISNIRVDSTFLKNQDEIIFVYWNRAMNKRTKELLAFVRDYMDKNSKYRIYVIYVNNDNLYKELF